jgi:hypothetical protein
MISLIVYEIGKYEEGSVQGVSCWNERETLQEFWKDVEEWVVVYENHSLRRDWDRGFWMGVWVEV